MITSLLPEFDVPCKSPDVYPTMYILLLLSISISFITCLLFVNCQQNNTDNTPTKKHEKSKRIVSLNGAISEIIAGLGYESKIVATDITSNFPESINKLPKVGHNRSIQAEGVLAQNPDVVVGIEKDLNPKVMRQIKSSGVKVILFKQEYSVKGTKNLIQSDIYFNEKGIWSMKGSRVRHFLVKEYADERNKKIFF